MDHAKKALLRIWGVLSLPAIHDFYKLTGAAATSQLLNFAFMAIVVSQVSPIDYGHYSMLIAIIGIVAEIWLGKLDQGIVGAEEEATQERFLSNALLVGVLTTVGALGLSVPAAILFASRAPGYWLLWCGVGAFMLASYTALTNFAVVNGKLGMVASRGVLLAACTGILQLLCLLINLPAALLVGWLSARLITVLVVARQLELRRILAQHRWTRGLIRKNLRLPLIAGPTALTNAASILLITPVMGWAFGAEAAGILALAIQIASLPLALVRPAATQALTANLASGTMAPTRFVKLLVLILGCSSIGFFVLCAFLAPSLLIHFVDSKWTAVEAYLPPVTLACCAALIGSPLHAIWAVRRIYREPMFWAMARVLVTLLTLVGSAQLGVRAVTAVWLWAVLNLCLYGLTSIRCWQLVKRSL